jgi:trehalose synthase
MHQIVPVGPLAPDRFRTVLSREQADAFDDVVVQGRELFAGRVVWNINSTANGGGVAEMLRSLIAYARGAGVDARWLVIEGDPEFFRVTKRLHNRLHGVPGDGGRLGSREHEIYEAVARENAESIAPLIAPGDVVLLHDPQTAGMTAPLTAAGAHVVWRCHVGRDDPNRLARSAWHFLQRYVEPAAAYVFSRDAFAWQGLDPSKLVTIPPSIDAFSPKNQLIPAAASGAILEAAGIAMNGSRRAACFTRLDGTPGRVDRSAQVWQEESIDLDDPLVVHVSRWDWLKDPIGTIDAFVGYVAPRTDAHLVLAGPDVTSVADDPEGRQVLDDCVRRWTRLASEVRSRIHLAALPMDDPGENAAIVNALQRRATVVVQKSLAEGFGLTVAEAMWKGKPVVASAIGGIQEQIVDGESGVLVASHDLEEFGDAVVHLLSDPGMAAGMGSAAQERVRSSFLGPRHLGQYLDLFTCVIETAKRRAAVTASR